MVRRGKHNDDTKSDRLRRRGQYRIQHVMMMMIGQAVLLLHTDQWSSG